MPAVPSALRPNAPPSELKAPGRLVTTTAAGTADAAGSAAAAAAAAAASPAPLVVPEAVNGTADPFWRDLLQHIESADGAHSPPAGQLVAVQRPQFLSAFQPGALARLLPAMPASVLTALIHGVAADGTPPASKAAYLHCLAAAVKALAAAAAEGEGDASLSASQQVWQPRGAPVAASLAEVCREPQLLSGLQAAAAAGSGEEAAAAAAEVARALLSSEAAVAAVAAAAADGSAGLQEGLAQVAQRA